MKPASHPGRPQAAPALFQLLAESSLARAALNACGVPLVLVDAGGAKRAVSYVNAAFTAYFGFSEADALGKSLAALLLRGDDTLLQRVLTDSPAAWPLTVWCKDGSALQAQLASGGVRAADGRLTHWVLTFLLSLRLEAGAQPARSAQQPRIEIAPADELHAERQPVRRLHQR